MTKAELVEKVAENCGLTKANVTEAINATFDAIADALAAGDKVAILGFGSFESRERAAREAKNPRTGEVIHLEACKVPAFKASDKLRQMCK